MKQYQKERFKYSVNHLEYEGLIHYVYTLYSTGQTSLYPFGHRRGETRSDMRGMAQWEPGHVYNRVDSANLEESKLCVRTKKHYEWFEYYLKIKGGDRTRETVERIFIRNLISLLTYTREIAMEYSSKGRVITGIRLDLFQRATYRLERSVLS